MTAHQIFPEIFSKENLNTLYKEKIARSPVVGRDGVRRRSFEEKLENEISLILRKIDNESYWFTGYKQKLISKGANNFPRQLSIPTFRDRLALRALCDLISEIFKDSKTRPPHEYTKEIKKILKTINQNYCFLRVDIRQYYPSIKQEILLLRIRARIRKRQVLSLLQKALRTPTGKRNTPPNENAVGIPQGLSISNILAAIYLRNIDRKYNKKTNYFRYVDDILIICKESEAKSLLRSLELDLDKLGLTCHRLSYSDQGKTRIAKLSEGLDYLGYHIEKDSIAVRESSYQRMYNNLIKVFTQYKYSKNRSRFLWRLNLKITGCVYEKKRLGWMFFFSQTEDKSQLVRLDRFVAKLLSEYNLGTTATEVKTFIKAFHEIRFSQKESTYIPQFDKYTREQMIDIICLHKEDLRIEEVTTWNVRQIEVTFWSLISKEVSNLEEDLIGALS